jgi:hypothetical protein
MHRWSTKQETPARPVSAVHLPLQRLADTAFIMISKDSRGPHQEALGAQLMARKQWDTVKALDEDIFHREKVKAEYCTGTGHVDIVQVSTSTCFNGKGEAALMPGGAPGHCRPA